MMKKNAGVTKERASMMKESAGVTKDSADRRKERHSGRENLESMCPRLRPRVGELPAAC